MADDWESAGVPGLREGKGVTREAFMEEVNRFCSPINAIIPVLVISTKPCSKKLLRSHQRQPLLLVR